MYKNIYKFNQVILQNEDAMVIDNNEKVAQRIEELEVLRSRRKMDYCETAGGEEESADGFYGGLFAEQAEMPDAGMDGESNVIKAGAGEAVPDLEEISAQAKEIMEQAKREAEELKNEILQDANAEAGTIKSLAFEEGKEQGYKEGYDEAQAQIDKQRQALEAERKGLKEEYDELVSGLEPKFIELITDIYEKVFQLELSKAQNIIAHLVSSALHRIESSNSYLIHVSTQDYAYVAAGKKEMLAGAVHSNASVEVVEDMALKANECIIETDGGVFDCGLDTQLGELSQKLRLLSYIKE